MAVQVIRANRREHTLLPQTGGKIRVAAYCRVSTDSEEQESSYEAQCQHYMHYISSNPDWELVGIYADEGISGTSTKKREQFMQMIHDCKAGKIDMIITKSISRWARNTLDSLQNIRKLKELGIAVLFEKENINTMDAKGEVLLTIMSSIAQQESESISKNVKMGIQYQMQQGHGRLNTTRFMGFTRDPETQGLAIVPEEAVIVRRIYRAYLEGSSPGKIAAELTMDGIRTPAGKELWGPTTITSMLKNEKYCGDLLMQKYYTSDVLTHKNEKNQGEMPQYFVPDAHDPIIPKPVFYQVQNEIQRRSMLKMDPNEIRYGSRDALFGRLICGYCGRKLKKYEHPNNGYIEWRCRAKAYKKRSVWAKSGMNLCSCRNVPEKEVKRIILQAFKMLPQYRDYIMKTQAALWDGEIKRIDATLDTFEAQKKRMEDRFSTLVEKGQDESEEAQFLGGELELLENERTDLIFKRADLANKDVHLRCMMELIDTMQHKDPGDHDIEYKSPACSDYGEFFRRTRNWEDDTMIGEDGGLKAFYDKIIIRYMDHVEIGNDSYCVRFKCGFAIRFNLEKKKE